MKLLLFITWTYVVFAIQTALGSELAVLHVAPPLILTALLVSILALGEDFALIAAAVWGLVSDALCSGPFGVDLLGFPLAVMVFRRWCGVRTSLLGGSLCIAFLTGVELGIATMVRELNSVGEAHWPSLGLHAAVSFVYALPLALGLLGISRLFRRMPAFQESRGSLAEVSNSWRMLTH